MNIEVGGVVERVIVFNIRQFSRHFQDAVLKVDGGCSPVELVF